MLAAVAILPLTYAVMLLADRIVLRPLLARRRTAAMIIAGFAIGLVLRNGIVLLFGPDATAPARPLEMATPLLDFSVFAAARLTATERLVIVAGRQDPLAGRRSVKLEELSASPFIM